MTGDDRPDGNDGRPTDDRPKGVLRAILELFSEMNDAGGRTGRGGWTDGRTSVDYSVSVRGLDEALGEHPPGGTERSDRRETPAITTRETDGGLLVAVDLPESRTEGVSAEVDEDERVAVITAGGDEVGRVPLDDGEWTVVDVSVNNGVMEVRLTRE